MFWKESGKREKVSHNYTISYILGINFFIFLNTTVGTADFWFAP